MDFFKQILVACKGPTQTPSIQFQSTLDDEAFNSLPGLVIHQIFDEIPLNEYMKLRGVSKFWNDYILSSRILQLQANEENWNIITTINARKVYLDMRRSRSIISDQLNLDFFLGVRKLSIGQIFPQQLYNILSATKNLETLYLYDSVRLLSTNEDFGWAADLKIPAKEQSEWLKKLKHFELELGSFGATLQCTEFIRKLLATCPMNSIKIRDELMQTNEIFPATCFNYGANYVPTPVGVLPQFIRNFIDDHKTTVKEFVLNKIDGEMRIKVHYDPESEANQALLVEEIFLKSIPPLRKYDQPANFLGILDMIKNQTSIKTLEIGKYDGVIDTFEYRDLLLNTILANNATTLQKLELYTHVNNPEIVGISWKGSMFSSLHSLQTLCLRSNQTVKLQVLDEIDLLPSSLTVLKTTYCISTPFRMGPLENNCLESFLPNLKKLHVESVPWFVFSDGATPVETIDKTLITFLASLKNLKKWELTARVQAQQ